jgi:hypothetical protein
MWVFLSSRLRTWVLLAVALPVARGVVHRLATASANRNADSVPSRALRGADAGLARVARRRETKRR